MELEKLKIQYFPWLLKGSEKKEKKKTGPILPPMNQIFVLVTGERNKIGVCKEVGEKKRRARDGNSGWHACMIKISLEILGSPCPKFGLSSNIIEIPSNEGPCMVPFLIH